MESRTTQIPLETKITYSVISYPGKDTSEGIRNLILKNWMRTLKNTNSFFKLMENQDFYPTYDNYIKKLLKRPECIVRLAVLTEDLDTVLGFSISELNLLHYVWVWKDYRKKGIGNALVKFEFDYITHLTTLGMTLWNNKYPNVKFNPFL